VKLLLIVNALASSVTARGQVVIRKALSADHDVDMVETSRRGHATRLARGAAAQGADVVVVLGGDGTLNEAATGLAGTDTALAALPGGSTNVFARTIGLPNDPIEATGALLDALEQDSIKPIGLGSVDGRYFCFHTGVGFDAAVVEQVERRAALKRYAGHPLFAYAALTTWLRHYDRSRPRFAVEFDDGSVVEDGYFMIVLNTNPYTFVGNRPFDLAPEATLDRALAVITMRTLDVVPFIGIIASGLGIGRSLRSSKHIDYRTDVNSFRMRAHGPVPYQVDGDHLGDVESLDFHHEPGAIRLVVPTGEP
jgi:diacylglycerol kinase family enzyme